MNKTDDSLENKARKVIESAFPNDLDYQAFMLDFLQAWQGEAGLLAVCTMPADLIADNLPFVAEMVMEGRKPIEDKATRQRIDALRARYLDPLHKMWSRREVSS